jgi:hypothetical protein
MNANTNTNTQSTAERFFTAFYSGDVQGTRDAVTQDFTLLGPFASVHIADELLQLGAGLMSVVRDHKVLRCVVAGNEIAAFYEIVIEGPRGPGSLAIGGWIHRRWRPPVQRTGGLRLRSFRRHRLPVLTFDGGAIANERPSRPPRRAISSPWRSCDGRVVSVPRLWVNLHLLL